MGGGELGLGDPRGKGSPSVSKGPKLPKQLLQLLKNSRREVKRAHFRYTLGSPGPTQELEFMGPGGEVPSRSPTPGFSSHVTQRPRDITPTPETASIPPAAHRNCLPGYPRTSRQRQSYCAYGELCWTVAVSTSAVKIRGAHC